MKMKDQVRTCRSCQGSFAPRSHNQVFCSKRCNNKVHQRIQLLAKTRRQASHCKNCGVWFTPLNRKAVHCSKRCTNQFSHKRKCERGRQPAPKVLRECVECSRPFETARLYQNCCSAHCLDARQKRNQRVLDLKYRQGATPEQYASLYEAQEGKCAVCKEPKKPSGQGHPTVDILVLDHCHDKREPRSLLCQSCNINVGYYEKRGQRGSPEILAYLALHNPERQGAKP